MLPTAPARVQAVGGSRKSGPASFGRKVGADPPAMVPYAVFFAGALGAGIQPVQAMDRGHAEDIVRAEHPDARLRVIEAEQLEGVNRMRVLLAWLEALDAGAEPGG